MLETLVLVGTLSVTLLTYLWYSYKRPAGFPPGPPTIPILGSIPFIGIGQHPLYVTYTRLAEQYGGVMSIAIGNRWSIVLTGYDVIKEALLGQAVDFAGRASLEYRIKCFNPRQIGIGLCQYTDEWKQQRNVSIGLLRQMGYGRNSIEERIKSECSILTKTFHDQNHTPFDPNLMVSMAVCNVICYLCFGERYKYDDGPFLELMHDLDAFLLNIVKDADGDFVPIMRLRPGHRRTIKRFEQICKRLHKFLHSKVQERISLYDSNQEPADFVQAYHQETLKIPGGSCRLNEDWCVHIVTDFFVAGADTSTTTLTWILLYLIRYPRVQIKLYDKIHNVLGSADVTLADRSRLPYVEAVIMETLRYCSLGGLTFKATTRDTTFKGYSLPAGTEVVINDYQVNRDVKLWGDPEVFRPERFIGEDGTIDRPEYWIAFGLGRRSCFGEQLARQELFLFVVSLVQRLRFECESEEMPDETPLGEELILKPKPFKLKAIPR